MTTPNACQKITLSEALNRLPGPQGERSVGLFEHGSLVVKSDLGVILVEANERLVMPDPNSKKP